MTAYARMPDGLILPEDIARDKIGAMIAGAWPIGNPGAYRSANNANKNTAFWKTSDGSADADTLADLPTLRRQSRDLIRNEALPAGAIDTMVMGVVGLGVVPQSRIDAEFLGLSDEAASAWSRSAERIFNHIAGKPTFDAEGRSNFWQMQRLLYRSRLESGDVLALRRYIPRRGKALGVCVQVVEADRITTPLEKMNNSRIREGVEVDANGFPVAFHVMQEHPGDKPILTAATEFTRVPAYDKNGDPLALLLVPRLRPGQTRGVPHLAPVVELFKQLGRYTEAEVSAAVTAAMLAVFVKSPAPVGPLSGSAIPGIVGGVQVAPKGNGLTRLQSGMIIDLAPGEEIQVADATRPNTAFEAFCDAILSYVGSALGLPRDVLTKSYNASYSAARAALQDAFRKYLVERDDLNLGFNQPVWNWVLDEAVASGLLSAPGYFEDPMIREAYQSAIWVGPVMMSLDPGKDASAAEKWINLGIKSRQDVCAENGLDYDATLLQRAKEKKLEDAAGLTPPPPAGPANQPKPAGGAQ